MDWQALLENLPRDRDMPARAFRLAALTSVLKGAHYAHIPHPFSDEINGAGEYIPLSQRRPSVRSGLCTAVVDDSVSLLFSEGHFPQVAASDKATAEALAALVTERKLNELMIETATAGSVGSAAILFSVLKGKPFFTRLDTAALTPKWDPEDPDALLSVTEKYKVSGADLAAMEYEIPPDKLTMKFWFQRAWTATDETWFAPWPVSDLEAKPSPDPARSVAHGLGFVPVVWIRNLPGGDRMDGACTFEAAIDTVIEIDYQLSQSGRALKYAGDPKLVIRDASGTDKQVSGGAANAITISDPQGDAKLLEINGTAATAAIEYVRYLRALAMESMHGNRADADKLSAAQSGRAMELMNQNLVWLADRLRISYGEGALLSLLRMVCAASEVVRPGQGGLVIGGKPVGKLSSEGLSLAWPRWYAPTAQDRQTEAQTLQVLTQAALMSRDTATRILADTYDIADVPAERAAILADEQAADARAAAMPGLQTKANEPLPA
jgi:hypothetical protein